ncbi:hypothetical protein [Sporomusa aerivorans]|uniref:hypothetical protein n=1 Tax=Sporomusa aerivorans TaxID=204936 RepID=UPI00352BCCD1
MYYTAKIIFIMMWLCLAGLGGQSIAAAAGLQGMNIENLPEWEAKSTSFGGKLLLSDSPEMVYTDGILYQDTVSGRVRLFFYHVNATNDVKKLDVLLENNGHEPVRVTVGQASLGGPGYDWMATGKEAQSAYMAANQSCQLTIPPGGVLPLAADISRTAMLPNMLINGIYDLTADHPVTVKVMMLPVTEDSRKFSRTAAVLPADQWRLRGTFEGANRIISPTRAYDPQTDGVLGLTLADNQLDVYLRGIDATDNTPVINYGNYGVVYQIMLPSKTGGKVAYYLTPLGGSYAGAIGITHPEVSWSPVATPQGRLYFGENKHRSEFAFLGTYESGDPLSFTFSPPGASNLPVKIIVVPQ